MDTDTIPNSRRRVWSPSFDMSSIPDKIFMSERARRNARKRRSYTGGVVWGEHNPETTRCRCMTCIAARAERHAEKAAQPKRGRGRPRRGAENIGADAVDITGTNPHNQVVGSGSDPRFRLS